MRWRWARCGLMSRRGRKPRPRIGTRNLTRVGRRKKKDKKEGHEESEGEDEERDADNRIKGKTKRKLK